jgi:hypothetical protein
VHFLPSQYHFCSFTFAAKLNDFSTKIVPLNYSAIFYLSIFTSVVQYFTCQYSPLRCNIFPANIHLCDAIFYLPIFPSAVQYFSCQYSPLQRNILPAYIHLCGAIFYLLIYTSVAQYFTCQYSPVVQYLPVNIYFCGAIFSSQYLPLGCNILSVHIHLCGAIFYLSIFTSAVQYFTCQYLPGGTYFTRDLGLYLPFL